MKKEIYSKCGMRCDLCLLYRPNVEENDRRDEICRVYSKVWPGFTPDPKTVICDGCANTGANISLFSPDCEARKCAFEKGHIHCGYCSEYPCSVFPSEPSQEELHQKIDIERQWTWEDEKLMEAYRCKHFMDEFRKRVFVQTERLVLRNVAAKDVDIMFDYRNNELCAKYQRGQTKDRDGIAALVERRSNDTISVDTNWMVAVALKDTDEMVGEIVVMPNDGAISLGYTFSYKHHRKGYAFEALSALTNLLHERYPEWDFICFTETQNEASKALLKKLGYKDMGYIPQLDSQMFGKWTEEFRKPTEKDIAEITAFKQEFEEHKSGMDGTGTLFRDDAAQWLEYNRQMEAVDNPSGVPSLQYGLFRKEDGRLLGLLQIRLELKGYLIDFGGNIGYCVRPSERRKGYAREMLRSALDICREKGLSRVLVTCLADNVGSAKTIEACGGVFEKTVFDDRNYKADMKRYWIEL